MLKRNAFFGFAGFVVPALTILATYPILASRLGAEAFGIFVLASSIGGAISFIDLGISAATVKYLAEDMERQKTDSAAEIISTSLLFYGVVGITVGLLVWLAAPWLAGLFAAEIELSEEAVWAFRLAGVQFAAFFLLNVILSLFKGMLEFHWSAVYLSLLTILTYVGAVAAVLIGGAGLIGVVIVSVVSHWASLLLAAGTAFQRCRHFKMNVLSAKPSVAAFRRMIRFGAYMAVNSVSGLFLYQIQRFLVGALFGPAAVTVFHLSVTFVSKVHSVIGAITEVLFPFSSAERNIHRVRYIYLRMLSGSAVLAAVALGILVIWAEPILTLWIGEELSRDVTPLVPYFAAAYFVLALSAAPYHLVNGTGKPWVNTLSYAGNALLNVLFIAVFLYFDQSLKSFALAFVMANIVNGLLYQAAVECWLWRRKLLVAAPTP